MKSLSVLVCGGAGYIRSHMCKQLARAGHKPITFDNFSTGHRWAVKWARWWATCWGLIRMLRMERAELFLASNNLDAAIQEMERGWRGRRKEPRIAFYAAALLATAGRYDEAREWAERPLSLPWSWKHWLAQTDQQAYLLIEAIDDSKDAVPPPN